MLLVGAAAAALFAYSQAAKAAQIIISGDTIAITGDIVDGDGATLARVMAGEKVHTILIGDSPGGHSGESMVMARLIRGSGAATIVAGKCVSACVTIFAGGSRRIVSGGSLYVHSAREGSSAAGQGAKEGPSSYQTTMTIARFFRSLGAPYSVIGKMTGTPPQELSLLGPADLRDWGVEIQK
jgi:hypothetical protein